MGKNFSKPDGWGVTLNRPVAGHSAKNSQRRGPDHYQGGSPVNGTTWKSPVRRTSVFGGSNRDLNIAAVIALTTVLWLAMNLGACAVLIFGALWAAVTVFAEAVTL